MAYSHNTVIILVLSAVCFLSLLGFAYGQSSLKVEGTVYCDTCRTQFMTRISEKMAGAKVRLECRDRKNESLTYSVEGDTNDVGRYSLPIQGDHEDEVCETVLVKSSKPDCDEVNKDAFTRRSARVSLTKNNGIASGARMANPLGFMKKKPIPECVQVLKELGINPSRHY